MSHTQKDKEKAEQRRQGILNSMMSNADIAAVDIQPENKDRGLLYTDLKILQLRGLIRIRRSYRGSATPIPWGELYTSLQQGVVDGAENNAPSFYLSRHY